MEANPNDMDNGNGNASPPEPGINLLYFFVELCKLTQIPTTGINILSQSVGEKILNVLRDSQSKLIRFEGLMNSLCDITDVTNNGEDPCSPSFVESVLANVRQDSELVKFIRNYNITRTERNHESQPPPSSPPEYNSNGQSSSFESSGSASNENNEHHHGMDSVQEDVKVLPEVSQTIPIGSSSVPIPPRPSPHVINTTSTPQQSPSPGPSFVIPATYHHVPTPVPKESEKGTTSTPALSPTLPEEGHQSGLPSLEALGQPQGTNEADVGTGSGAVNEIPQSTLPSTSRQFSPRKLNERHSYTKKNDKKKTRIIKKKKIHVGSRLGGKFYCSCSSKLKSIGTLKHHIKYFNSVWKFNCEECPKKLYDLTKLKQHMTREHKIKNPLKEYVIGCTTCGLMFKSKMEFGNHRTTIHNIHKVPRQAPRRPGKKPRQSRLPSKHPKLVLPPDLKIDEGQQSGESGIQDQDVIADDDDTTQEIPRLRRQEDSNPNDVIDLVNLVSEDEEDNQIDESINQGHTPSPSLQMEQQTHPSCLIVGNQRESEKISVETSAELNRQNGRSDYGKCYGCIMCKKAFRDLQQLRNHLKERHQNYGQDVKCSMSDSKFGLICGMPFASCKSFHEHRAQKHRVSNNEQ